MSHVIAKSIFSFSINQRLHLDPVWYLGGSWAEASLGGPAAGGAEEQGLRSGHLGMQLPAGLAGVLTALMAAGLRGRDGAKLHGRC